MLFLFQFPILLRAQNGYYGKEELSAIYEEQEFSGQYTIFLPGAVSIREHSDHSLACHLRDHLNSTRVIADSRQRSQIAADYDPYGKQSTNVSVIDKEQCNYAGTYTWAEQTGLYLSPTRKYNPDSKRLLSPDLLRQSAGVYNYALDNPVTYVDPDGNIVTISWKEGAESREAVYHYDPGRRKLQEQEQDQHTYKDYVEAILDNLYLHMDIDFGNPARPQVENFLDRMVNDTKVKVNIFENPDPAKGEFFMLPSAINPYKADIAFNPLLGLVFANTKDAVPPKEEWTKKTFLKIRRG